MMKILAAAAMLSLSLTGASLAQSSSDGTDASGGGANTNQQDSSGGATDGTAATDENPADTSAGDEPQCPPGQKSADASATKADPRCVAE